MGLTGHRLGNYEDSHDEKTRAERVLQKAKEKMKNKKLKRFQLDSKTWVFTTSRAKFERFKKAYNSKDRVIWE